MDYSPEAAAFILNEADKVMQDNEPGPVKLERLWLTLMMSRARMLAAQLHRSLGPVVLDGPFKGMRLTPESMDALFGPVLTGNYEHELHDAFEHAIVHPYKNVLNIGCAFGYYSVGLALRMPQVQVFAFDTAENEQARCRTMAALNKVSDRVHVSGEFKGEDFAIYSGEKTLALVDIEGEEINLLDPAKYPALTQMDIIVELHDTYNESISRTIAQRFINSHDIEIIYNKPSVFDYTKVGGLGYYAHPVDSLVMAWENRSGPTPWAVMRAR